LLANQGDRARRQVVGLDGAAGPRRAPGDGRGTIRVVIAEGHGLVRAGYRALLESDGLIEVVAEAGSGRQAVTLALETRPDVVLLDLALPGLDALEAIERIVTQPAAAAVMLIVGSEGEERVIAGLRAGAVGVLEKGARSVELIEAVWVLARGRGVLSSGLVRRLLGERACLRFDRGRVPQELAELTSREREVVALVARGLSNDEIAGRLVISPKTAKTHVSRAMVKVGAHHRAQLVVLAYEAGMALPQASYYRGA
jgi:DNA-binding NarL/FixJ family response regulator